VLLSPQAASVPSAATEITARRMWMKCRPPIALALSANDRAEKRLHFPCSPGSNQGSAISADLQAVKK
jgi:hypothetical protein